MEPLKDQPMSPNYPKRNTVPNPRNTTNPNHISHRGQNHATGERWVEYADV